IPHRVESVDEVASIHRNRSRDASGLLLTVPIPEESELDALRLDSVLENALRDCEAAGIRGAAVTPFVLGRIGEVTEGRSVPANLALAENNARVAAEGAVALATAR
ncbi:MAG: pseudouridine-5'-phosphate glycosidase, partial [Actinomycetes bacterium]